MERRTIHTCERTESIKITITLRTRYSRGFAGCTNTSIIIELIVQLHNRPNLTTPITKWLPDCAVQIESGKLSGWDYFNHPPHSRSDLQIRTRTHLMSDMPFRDNFIHACVFDDFLFFLLSRLCVFSF